MSCKASHPQVSSPSARPSSNTHDRPEPDGRRHRHAHEGLGSAALWGDFPDRLQAATGRGVFVYSRGGYGASSPVELPRPLDYMQIEALDVLRSCSRRSAFAAGFWSGIPTGGRSRRSMPAACRITACAGSC